MAIQKYAIMAGIASIIIILALRGKGIGEQLGGFFTGITPAGSAAASIGTGFGKGFAGFGTGFGRGVQGLLEPVFWASAKLQDFFGDTQEGQAAIREHGYSMADYRERAGRI